MSDEDELEPEDGVMPYGTTVAGEGENICPTCMGSGKTDDDEPCPECGGDGRVREQIASG